MKCHDCPHTGGPRFECCEDAEDRRRRADLAEKIGRAYRATAPRPGRRLVVGLALSGTLLESGRG